MCTIISVICDYNNYHYNRKLVLNVKAPLPLIPHAITMTIAKENFHRGSLQFNSLPPHLKNPFYTGLCRGTLFSLSYIILTQV